MIYFTQLGYSYSLILWLFVYLLRNTYFFICFIDYYFIPYDFFTVAFIGRLLKESEWQQVTSGLQNTSEYSTLSQQCCHLSSHICVSSSHFSKNLWAVPSVQTTIGITLPLVFQCLFSSRARSKYFLSFRSLSFFNLWFVKTATFIRWQLHIVFFFCWFLFVAFFFFFC